MAVPATKLQFYYHLRRLRELKGVSKASADQLVRSVLYAWQKKTFPETLSRRAPYGSIPLLRQKPLADFTKWLDEQPFEEAAYWLATSYAVLVGPAVQAERALFFTPPALAHRVIDNLVSQGASLTDQRWHDPACGGAAFLVPIARRMAEALKASGLSPSNQLKRISKNISGNDLDPTLLDLSRSFLEMALYGLVERAGSKPKFNLRRGDGLAKPASRTTKPDVVALNPPYRKLRRDEVGKYLNDYAEVIEGQANIYGLFISQSIKMVKSGGHIGLLTPTSFLSGRTFSKLRKYITSTSNAVLIDMVSGRSSTFVDVEQETAITILRTKQSNEGATETQVNVLASQGIFSSVGKLLLPTSGKPWPIPRSPAHVESLDLARKGKFGLKDYGYKIGVGHLVGYRDKRHRFKFAGASPGKGLVIPLIWATDISPSGHFSHGRNARLSRLDLYVQVKTLEDKGVVRQPSVLMQRLTSNDQRSRLVAAAVPKSFLDQHGGFVCENHVVVLEPTDQATIDPALLAKILNSRIINDIFRCISGATNVSVFELNELKLPNPSLVLKAISEKNGVIDDALREAYSSNRLAG